MKIGRNDPCWCGSGMKYKKCHLDRHEQEEMKPWEAAQGLRKAQGAKYCSVPDSMKNECNGNIVRAHTVSKSMNLRKIERDGHVYAFVPSFENLTKNNGVLHPELTSINKASTFTGFCSHHDKHIFSPVEDQVFQASKEQCFLLMYRTQAREYFTKTGQFKSLPQLKEADRGKSHNDQFAIQDIVQGYSLGVNAGVRDSSIYKTKLDNILQSSDFTKIKGFVVNFSNMPTVLCSGGIFPECDFQGNTLQDLSDLNTTPDFLTFNIIANDNGGSVVFTWINDGDSKGNCEQFIESLKRVSPDKVTDALLRFFFEFCENIFMAPAWWDCLEIDKRSYLIQRLSTSATFFLKREATCLCDDGTVFDDWKIIDHRDI